MRLKSLFEKPLEPRTGAILLAIVLVLLVLSYKAPTGEIWGYGKAWAFASGLRWFDTTILSKIFGETYVATHPHWKVLTSSLGVAVSLTFFIIGGFVAAKLSNEFGIKIDKSVLPESIIGGLLMGIGIAIMTTCNIGTFLNSFPQLAIGGYLAAVGLIIGTYIGAKYYERRMGL